MTAGDYVLRDLADAQGGTERDCDRLAGGFLVGHGFGGGGFRGGGFRGGAGAAVQQEQRAA